MAVSEMNDMGHDVFFPRNDGGIKAYAYHEGSDTKLELERANGVFELPVDLVSYKQINSKSSNTGPYSSRSAPEQIGSLTRKCAKTEHPSDRGRQRSMSHGILAKWIVSVELVWWSTVGHATTVSAGI